MGVRHVESQQVGSSQTSPGSTMPLPQHGCPGSHFQRWNPPGMEGLWEQYKKHGYDMQRLFRGHDWKERGVDHSIIGHMWRLAALHRDSPREPGR
jgi:hypothetical protein